MADYNAITPGTDLARYARELMRMHDTVIGGGRTALQPRPLVSRSWQRVLGFGLVPDKSGARDPLPPARLEQLRAESPLRLVIDDLARVISSVADASHFLMVVTNGDGIILWRRGDTRVRRQADQLGFSEGARWTEDEVGTNAIGTALEEANPVQLFSGEHFEQAQHPWYCTAFPIHDPRTGELLGIVDISGPALTLHPAISALVETAVLLAESLLRRHHEAALERLRVAAVPIVSAAGGPALVVDDAGWVAHSAGVSTRDRIAAPQPDKPLAVPGLGLCLPERLDLGWLIRPAATERRINAHLTLGAKPVIEIRADAEPWRVALSRRHAQILQQLAGAGPAGLTPYDLSVALFGDGEHLVAARAEVSRLRRSLGAIVDGSPYRIADGVQLTVGA
ncbi:GAF domain-containing protein [Flexivirga oryzae]|uniref:Riboflavin biosynthesis pyrimidine reductase n=1 Tax=Flexivirga oryzae TaxID=1794944 RepID=A0A839N6V6_9MICO|nr:riboflavin biosynthesis pyrimidine reductase [Flexivirga oryzae]